MRSVLRYSFALSTLFLFAPATPAAAAVCTVPSGSHPTIQAAVDDLACTEIVIAAGNYVESVEIDRNLEINGVSSTATVIEGRIMAMGGGVELRLGNLKVDAGATSSAGCFPVAVDIGDGATLTGSDLIAINADGDACLLFGDGFESGDTGAWGNTVP
jgi:pectin methylesterase-like acyl-CoA thioesterase